MKGSGRGCQGWVVGGITDSMNQNLLSGRKEGLQAAVKNKEYLYPTSAPLWEKKEIKEKLSGGIENSTSKNLKIIKRRN